MKINKQLFDFVLNRPRLLNLLLNVSNFEKFPFLQKQRNKVIAKAIEGIYSAGENLNSAEKRIIELEQKNIGVILNYAMEAAGEEGIHIMKEEYCKILECLKNHTRSCIALKPTALIPVEQIMLLSDLMNDKDYKSLDLDRIMNNDEIEKVAAPFVDLSKKALDAGTRILIDAEQSNLQPGVDLLAIFLMKIFNKNMKSIIYNTYQLYLKDSPLRLNVHKSWLESNNARFAAKVVRGAYLSYENNLKFKPHPNYVVCDSKNEVDNNYNNTVSKLITEGNSSLIVATHNFESLNLLKRYLKDENFYRNTEYAFLMGFGENISTDASKLRCLEYVPYGPSDVKIPYLLRRLEENISVFDNKN